MVDGSDELLRAVHGRHQVGDWRPRANRHPPRRVGSSPYPRRNRRRPVLWVWIRHGPRSALATGLLPTKGARTLVGNSRRGRDRRGQGFPHHRNHSNGRNELPPVRPEHEAQIGSVCGRSHGLHGRVQGQPTDRVRPTRLRTVHMVAGGLRGHLARVPLVSYRPPANHSDPRIGEASTRQGGAPRRIRHRGSRRREHRSPGFVPIRANGYAAGRRGRGRSRRGCRQQQLGRCRAKVRQRRANRQAIRTSRSEQYPVGSRSISPGRA